MTEMTKRAALAALNETTTARVAADAHFCGRRFVPGEGSPEAALLLVGEAPGAEEEKAGRPFVGRAGRNLDAFLAALALKRDDLYITNLVKTRPAKQNPATGRLANRPPNKEEIAFFLPCLKAEIAIIAPRIVITLGNFPLRAVLGNNRATVGLYHGRLLQTTDYDVFPLYHPAAVIYNQALSAVYAADLAVLKETIEH